MTNTPDLTAPEAVERLISGPLTEIARSKDMPVTDDDVDTCKLVAATLRALSAAHAAALVRERDANAKAMQHLRRAEAAEAERDALKSELARLRALMEARDAFERGEPSQPPETGAQKRAFLARQKETDT